MHKKILSETGSKSFKKCSGENLYKKSKLKLFTMLIIDQFLLYQQIQIQTLLQTLMLFIKNREILLFLNKMTKLNKGMKVLRKNSSIINIAQG